MVDEYVVIQANSGSGIQTVLVNLEVYNESAEEAKREGMNVAEYFFCPSDSDAKEVGRIQVMGDTSVLDDTYRSE